MVVRIQLQPWSKVAAVKSWAAWLLNIAAICCFVVVFWILSAGLKWAGAFLIAKGIFSHWQVWISFGIVAQLAAFRLKRPKRRLVS